MREKGATGKRFEWAKQSATDEIPPLDLAVCPACKHTKIAGQRCESAFCRETDQANLSYTLSGDAFCTVRSFVLPEAIGNRIPPPLRGNTVLFARSTFVSHYRREYEAPP